MDWQTAAACCCSAALWIEANVCALVRQYWAACAKGTRCVPTVKRPLEPGATDVPPPPLPQEIGDTESQPPWAQM